MDVKGAKALSERITEAARNVDLRPAKAMGSGDSPRTRTELAHPLTAGEKGCGRVVPTESS
jgi:hypothetical protein